ncbi:septum formation family protein [Actinorugispora endophytica]|uniref:Putative regulator of septum formation n=1 Tax=Actinorugispora endophytica TaxID=1605990 RepID=A0A4R6UZ47_9ACTN|nr:septum formation family protein [Actinorugispora endophytica]TDQ51596.1 putative regulator of septum formation [Actinorugispora endophytica]
MTSGTFRSAAGRGAAATAIAGTVLALSGCGILEQLAGDDVFTLVVGDCLSSSTGEGEVSSVPTVDCAEPHDSEVYASHMIADGAYPGEDAIYTEAEEVCTTEFETFVGMAYLDSELDFEYLYPTEDSWNELDDREILCMVVDPAGQTTGSLEGAAR